MKRDCKGQQSPGSSMFFMFFMMIILMMILFSPGLVGAIGMAIGYALNPVIGFDGSFPLLTILIASIIMTLVSTLIRHYYINWADVARNQKVMSAFNKARRDALMSRNTAKLEKLNQIQPEILKRNMKSTTGQLKPMMFTMVIIILFFAWLSTFIYSNTQMINFSVPWNLTVPMNSAYILPYWILLYMIASIPLGMFFQRAIKYYSFKKKLAKMEADGVLLEKKLDKVEDEAKREKMANRERAETNFECTICGRRVRKGRWAYKCVCGKYYHEHCAHQVKECPTCKNLLVEARE